MIWDRTNRCIALAAVMVTVVVGFRETIAIPPWHVEAYSRIPFSLVAESVVDSLGEKEERDEWVLGDRRRHVRIDEVDRSITWLLMLDSEGEGVFQMRLETCRGEEGGRVW